MLSWPPSHEDWQDCLSQGDIVVVLTTVSGPIAAARSVSRLQCKGLLEQFPGHLASRSATAGLAAVALSKATRIGVDVERIDPYLVLDAEFLEVALHLAERATIGRRNPAAFHRLWTRKESALKAAGVGLALPPATVHVGWDTEDWSSVGFGARASVASVRSLASPPGFAAAVATLGAPRGVQIVTHFTAP